MVPTQDFESYSVNQDFRGHGLSYALTYALLRYCSKKGITSPQVSNAHGALLSALPQVGFDQVGATRVTRRNERAASFRCWDVDLSIEECRRKLHEHRLTLKGPIKTPHSCVIF
jgi:hypothetical protein